MASTNCDSNLVLVCLGGGGGSYLKRYLGNGEKRMRNVLQGLASVEDPNPK